MENFSQFLLYIPGIVIFLVGSGKVRQYMRIHKKGACVEAAVVRCEHVVRKDKAGREVYNYYDVFVEFVNPENYHKEGRSVKSPVEYVKGQQVLLYLDGSGGDSRLTQAVDESVFNPWVLMVIGALLVVLALEENQGNEVAAMACLAAVLLFVGGSLIANYILLKRKGLQRIDAEIVDVFKRQISRGTKILKADKFTYYPIVRYEIDGRENMRMCNINSGSANSFKTGEHMPLYLDSASGNVMEKHESPGVLIGGIVVFCIGILAALSILSAI
ncbi:MAG: hypothetical protein J6O71_03550 [Lachnospiraceae bacterium]|nr:hypothetical protein [Lachnospiraceae bacterium]